MARSKWIEAVGLLSAAVVLAACGGGGESDSAAASGECRPDSTTLRFGVHTEVRGFVTTNGGSNGPAGGHERTALFDTLMRYDSETQKYIPQMAQQFEPNADFTQWTLILRDGMKFRSGNPVTTEAVKFSVERHGAPDSRSLLKGQMDNIAKMDIVSPLEMVFTLKVPQGDFTAVFNQGPGMLADPAVFQAKGPEAFGKDPGEGTAGAYMIKSYVPGEELVLVRNPDYWNKDAKLCVGTLRFVYIEDETARKDALINHELDVAYFNTPSIIGDVREAGLQMQTSVSWGDYTMLINHGTGGADRPGKDLRVRQALAHAIDPKVVSDRSTGGAGIPSEALVSDRSKLWSPGLAGPSFDPALARTLLEQAKADGYDGTITLSCNRAAPKVEWAIAVKALLESVGFSVQLDNARSLTDHVVNVFYTGNYDLACFSVSMDDASPWATLQTTMGQDAVAQKRVGYQSPAMQVAMDQLRAAGDDTARQAATQEIQKVYNAEIPIVITTSNERGAAWNDNVHGLKFMNTAVAVFDDVTIAN